jgi:hypothetical protein
MIQLYSVATRPQALYICLSSPVSSWSKAFTSVLANFLAEIFLAKSTSSCSKVRSLVSGRRKKAQVKKMRAVLPQTKATQPG